MCKLFKNREEAAIQLATLLFRYKNDHAMVLAIPGGGVPVGQIIAKELSVPVDVAVYKKTEHTFYEEYFVEAVNVKNEIINNPVEDEYMQPEVKRLRESLKERYKCGREQEPSGLKNKIVIITDDGIATGSSSLMTVKMVRKQGAAQVIVTAPVISSSAINLLKNEADEVIALSIPRYFMAVEQFYEDFGPIQKEEMVRLLK